MSVLTFINWKRFGQFLLGSIIAILGANLGRLIYKASSVQAASATFPYTVLRTESGFDQTGTLKYTNHYVEAVQSNGSWMWRGSTNEVQQRKLFFANGDEVRTNELLARKSTYPKQHAGAILRRNPQTSCFSEEDLKAGWTPSGQDSIGGHRAFRLVNTASKRTMTVWYALDAGCALLQQRFEHETGVTEQSLAALIPGEPDAAHFQIPASFQEVAPSGLFACSGTDSDCKSTPLPDYVGQRLDKRYSDKRAKAPIPN